MPYRNDDIELEVGYDARNGAVPTEEGGGGRYTGPHERGGKKTTDTAQKHIGTKFICVVNLLMFVYEMYHANWEFEPFIGNPMLGPTDAALTDIGARSTQHIVQESEMYRLLVSIFLHSGLITLFGDMMVLFALMSTLEENVGSLRVMIVYVAGGLMGNVFACLFEPTIQGAGSNGAIFGILASYVAEYQHNKVNITPEFRCAYLRKVLIWMFMGFAVGLLPYVDNFELIFGAFGGWSFGLLAYYNSKCNKFTSAPIRKWMLSATGGFTYLIVLLSAGLCLFEGVDISAACPQCPYISCLESPWWNCSYSCDEGVDCGYGQLPDLSLA